MLQYMACIIFLIVRSRALVMWGHFCVFTAGQVGRHALKVIKIGKPDDKAWVPSLNQNYSFPEEEKRAHHIF